MPAAESQNRYPASLFDARLRQFIVVFKSIR